MKNKSLDKYGHPKTTAKKIIENVVKSVSIIAFVVALIVMGILYYGPEITLNTQIIVRLAVPSVILLFSIIIVYNMWITNGQQSAAKEKDYIDLQDKYKTKSDHLYYPTLQDFLDYEEKRRYQVEETRLARIINRETSLVTKMEESVEKDKEARKKLKRLKRFFTSKNTVERIRIKWAKRRIKKLHKAKDSIRIVMPYDKSEEFDYLRYNTEDTEYKEWSPKATSKHLRSAKIKKYVNASTVTLFGFNILSMGATTNGGWAAFVMTVLAALSLVLAVVQGYLTGYKNISVISTGVYKTAISFIDQADSYCVRLNKQLRYKERDQFIEAYTSDEPTTNELNGSELYADDLIKENDLFAKAAKEVTKTDIFRI